MSDTIQLRNKHLFGLITSAAFHDYNWDRLHMNNHIQPILHCIKQAVKDKIDGKLIEYVVLAQEMNNEAGNEGGNTFSLLFYAKLVLGVTKDGKAATIKRSLKTDPLPYSPAGLPYQISIKWAPNPYKSNSNPLKAHIEKLKEFNLPGDKWENFEQDNEWHLATLQAEIMDDILSCSTQEEAKEMIRNSLDIDELPGVGVKQLKAFKELARQNSDAMPFTPPPFCKWGLKKLEDLEPHCKEKDPHLKKLDKNCRTCREFRVWQILHSWYGDIFVKQKTKGKHMLNTGTIIEEVMRKRFIVVLSKRKKGKSKWFRNLCYCKEDPAHKHCDKQHIAWIKHKLSRENTVNIGPDCWLVVLDDFSWHKHDKEMMKAITSAEFTELDGKWLSKSLPPGIPCVVLMNEEVLYNALKQDPDFKDEAIFCNVEDFSLAPDDVDNSALDYTGPSRTLSDDEDAPAAPKDAIAIIMQKDGKPTHVPMEEFELLRKKFDDLIKEIKTLKMAYNNVQQQNKDLQKELMRKRGQMYFKVRDDDEEEDVNINPRKQRRGETNELESTGIGSEAFAMVPNSVDSSGRKSVSSRSSRDDVPAFAQE